MKERIGKLNSIEKGIILITTLIIGAGIIMGLSDDELFRRYVVEDGFVEWLTVIGLLAASLVSFKRGVQLWNQRKAWFLFVTFSLAVLLFLAAGEEISWGQRIFGIQSSEYFQKNNAQGETNFHNLVVDGVKLNKIIFSTLLSVALGVYLVLIPLLYNSKKAVQLFLDRSGVPIARFYQILCFLTLIVVTSLFRHEKSPELLECGAALLFFLIVRYPQNLKIFQKGEHLRNSTS